MPKCEPFAVSFPNGGSTREPDPVIPGTMRQKFKNRKTSCCCPCEEDSIGMPTLHIGQVVSEKTGTEVKGFSFIVMGDIRLALNSSIIDHS